MKLRKIILMAAIAFASVFALASSPYAYYRTSCGKTVIGHEQSYFEFYGQWWDYVGSLNGQYCPGFSGMPLLQIQCTLSVGPDDMSTYTIKTVGSITLPW